MGNNFCCKHDDGEDDSDQSNQMLKQSSNHKVRFLNNQSEEVTNPQTILLQYEIPNGMVLEQKQIAKYDSGITFTIKQKVLHIGAHTQVMCAPFQIIQTSVSQNLIKQIHAYEKQNLPEDSKYRVDQQKWYLHAEGYYMAGNKVKPEDQELKILTDKIYFSGMCKFENEAFLAEGQGVLITERGYYDGNFSKGKAEKKGDFFDLTTKTRYNGEWRRGVLIHGKIDCPQYLYEGELQKGVPYGKGTLNFKEKQIKFKGEFVNGLYEGRNCQYETDRYIYKGQFSSGMKNGYGELNTKSHKKMDKDQKERYMLSVNLRGQWFNDQFAKMDNLYEQGNTKTKDDKKY